MHGKNEDLGRNLTPAQAAEYNQTYKRGSRLLKKHMSLHDQEPAPSPA